MGDGVRLLAEAAADELDAGDDVAPLVARAGLHLDTVGLVQVPEVVGLQQHVAELGVRDAVLAVDAAAHGVLGDHLVDREVLADVAEELEHVIGVGPVGVVDQRGLERPRLEVEQLLSWALMHSTLWRSVSSSSRLRSSLRPPGIADHARGATGERERAGGRPAGSGA